MVAIIIIEDKDVVVSAIGGRGKLACLVRVRLSCGASINDGYIHMVCWVALGV